MAEVRGTAAKQGGTWLGKKGVITGWADVCKIQVPTSKQDLKNAEHLHRGARSRPHPVQEDSPVVSERRASRRAMSLQSRARSSDMGEVQQILKSRSEMRAQQSDA